MKRGRGKTRLAIYSQILRLLEWIYYSFIFICLKASIVKDYLKS